MLRKCSTIFVIVHSRGPPVTLTAVRILELTIGSWRNLRDVNLRVPEDAPLVCLVGENGTGKSAVLELLSTAAHSLGISQGVETNRGNPFGEPHDVSLTVRVPTGDLPATQQRLDDFGLTWDGRLRLVSSAGGQKITAEGVADEGQSADIANTTVSELRSRNETQHLFLDADRAYPPTQFQPQQLIDIWNQDYRAPGFNRQWSYRPSRTLYEEWIKYLVGIEERTGAQLIADTRSARAAGAPDPVFVDPFEEYRALLQQTLPHLMFVGVETSGVQRTVKFNSAGLDLDFARLSGGEREIAFLTGQVDRFRLQRGLLLVDEPELHLNPDLLRAWLAFLRDIIRNGQVWFATHSLEAVEVAGPASTFVFERQPETRLVVNPSLLAGRPVLSALSAAIGSPAFSLAKLRFVFIEGDRQTRERERFYAVCGESEVNRFLEGGGCNEVLRRLNMIAELAGETAVESWRRH
jgi:predicted ATPase